MYSHLTNRELSNYVELAPENIELIKELVRRLLKGEARLI